MLRKHNGPVVLAGLGGPLVDPPAKPDFLTSGLGTRWTDTHNAKRIGKAGAEEFDLAGEDGQFHYEGVIDAQAEEAIAETCDGFEKARTNAESIEADAHERVVQTQPKLVQVIEQDNEDAETERRLKDLRGIGPVWHGVVIALMYAATLPIDLAAATALPLPPIMQLLIAIMIGAIMMASAEFAGSKWAELDEARKARAQDPGAFETLKREAIVSVVAPLGLIVLVAFWRGQAFAAESEVVGALFPSGMAANLALTAIGLIAFAAAVAASRSYHRMKPLTDIRKKRKRNKEEMKTLQRTIDDNERIEKQAMMSQEHLQTQGSKRLAEIEAVRDRRKKRLRHDAGLAEHQHGKKLVNKGLKQSTTSFGKVSEPVRNGHKTGPVDNGEK